MSRKSARDVIRPTIAGPDGRIRRGAATPRTTVDETSTLIGHATSLAGISHIREASDALRLCENHCSLTINSFGGGQQLHLGQPLRASARQRRRRTTCRTFTNGSSSDLLGSAHGDAQPRPRTRSVCRLGSTCTSCCRSGTRFLTRTRLRGRPVRRSPRRDTLRGRAALHPVGHGLLPGKADARPHRERCLSKGVDAIFYPCMTYNVDEETGDQPLQLSGRRLLSGAYRRRTSPHSQEHRLHDAVLSETRGQQSASRKHAVQAISAASTRRSRKSRSKAAVEAAYRRRTHTTWTLRTRAQRDHRATRKSTAWTLPLLAGRPYHVDPEINHGIDQLIASFGLWSSTEDAVWQLPGGHAEPHVLNQWTYHLAHVRRGQVRCTQKEMPSLSSWCPSAAASTPSPPTRCAPFCENGGKIYTQLKIDEISNLGAAKIRIRSLLAAVEEGRKLAEQQNA